MFVSTVRALGFAMSLDVAEIANTLNAAPVTVLDVGCYHRERRWSAPEDLWFC